MNDYKTKFRSNIYYILVGLLSIILMIFLPMFNSDFDISTVFPNSPGEWFTWGISKLAVAVATILLYACFINQGELNSKDNDNYKKAKEILLQVKATKNKKPRSPGHFKFDTYSKKGVSVFFSSILSLISFGPAIINFDWQVLFVYCFVLLTGIVFGVLGMKKSEIYWCEEFYLYALMIQEEWNQEKTENTEITEENNNGIDNERKDLQES